MNGYAVWLLVTVWLAPQGSSPQQGLAEGVVLNSGSVAVPAVVYLVPENGIVRAPDSVTMVIDQVGLRYTPRVLVVAPGTTVSFYNSDEILHNVFSPAGPGLGFDLGTYPPSDKRSHDFDELGTHIILCNVHPEMYAYVVVTPTPYAAVADEEGRFRIDEIPAGRYDVHIWQRREIGQAGSVVIRAGEVARLSLDIGDRR